MNAVVRFALRNGGRVGQHFPVPVRAAASAPLLTLLHRSRQGYRNDSGRRRPRLTPDQRARLLPYFADDIRLLESVTGNSYADWLTDRHLTTLDTSTSIGGASGAVATDDEPDRDGITVATHGVLSHRAGRESAS